MNKKTRLINGFKGLDQNSFADGDPSLSPDMLNFKINAKYELEKRDGYDSLSILYGPARAMWSGNIGGGNCLLYVSGGTIQRYDLSTGTHTKVGSIADKHTTVFEFAGNVYFLNGADYYRYDGTTFESVEGYIPKIAISCSPNGAGTAYEQINLLTAKRRQIFSANGTDKVFQIAEKEIDNIDYVNINGSSTLLYSKDTAAGTVTFHTTPTAGINNIEICYSKAHNGRNKIILSAYSMLFGSNTDTRVFLWGNPSLPSYRFHSELADGVPSAEYFPENNYTSIGNTKITDIVQQYDRQLIFTPDSAFYSYCDIRSDSLGKTYSSFPVFSLHSTKGNLLSGSSCVIDGKPVTFCRDGLNIWEPTNIENEKNAVCFSHAIDNTIREISESNDFSGCVLFDYQSNGECYFAYGGKIYIYNYKLGVWYVYDGINAVSFCDCFGKLYIGSSDNIIFYFSKRIKTHAAYWTSSYLTLDGENKKKDVICADIAAQATSDAAMMLEWSDSENNTDTNGSISVDFSSNPKQRLLKRRLRISMRRISAIKLKITAPAQKKLTLQSIGIGYITKGDLSYGV